MEQPRRIALRGREVSFVLKRSQRRQRIAFLVDDAGLSVHAPWRASEQAVETAIHGAARWILGKLDEWSHRAPARTRTWTDGDTIEYLGRPVTLSLVHEPTLSLAELTDPETLRIRLPRPEDPIAVRAAAIKWYRRHAERHFPDRVMVYADLLGVERPKILLSDAAGRWGSCNSKGEVRLNWRLMQAPTELVDYVIAHEVAHLLHMNHSARFWRAVGRIFPDYETARAELSAQSRHFMSL
ncbi:MAG: M48 family metallopeptidase [Burkholderiales bacterium]|nr:M48 family metallopeptidase [Burkholderiales bacterium]